MVAKRTKGGGTATKAPAKKAETRGRPAHKPTKSTRNQVEAMAGYGIPHVEIALVLDITAKTLRLHYRRELDIGATKANSKVAETLYSRCVKDRDTTALIWWTKTRMRWRAAEQIELGGIGGGPVQVQMTDADMAALSTAELVLLKKIAQKVQAERADD